MFTKPVSPSIHQLLYLTGNTQLTPKEWKQNPNKWSTVISPVVFYQKKSYISIISWFSATQQWTATHNFMTYYSNNERPHIQAVCSTFGQNELNEWLLKSPKQDCNRFSMEIYRSRALNEIEMSSMKRESTKRGGEREGWGRGHVREIEHLEARTVTSMQLRKDSNM